MSMVMPRSRPRRRIRKRWIFAWLVGAVALAGLACLFYLGAVTKGQLRRAIEEADRLDPGWRIPELEAKRTVLDDAGNSAVQVAAILRNLPTSWPPLVRKPSPPGTVAIEYETDFLTVVSEIPPEIRLDEALAAQIRGELAKYPEASAEGRKLADMPGGRFALAFPPNPIALLLPHLSPCRNLARFLQSEAIVRAHDGDIDGALEDCRAILGVARAIGDEPTTISQLVRIAFGSVAMSTAERVLAQGEASDAALARFQADLAAEADHPFALVSLRGERAMASDLFGKLTTGELNMSALSGAGAGGGIPVQIPGTSAYFQYNHALMLTNLNRAVEIAKRPAVERSEAFEEWERDFRPPDNGLLRTLGALNYLLAPAIANIGRADLRHKANLATCIAMLAAERHRLARGARPESVEKIDPKFTVGLTVDPFSKGPIRIKPMRDRLVIYNVGPDRKDDGGKFDPRRRQFVGFDLGWTLWDPPARRRPAKGELPADVFQKIPHDETEPVR